MYVYGQWRGAEDRLHPIRKASVSRCACMCICMYVCMVEVCIYVRYVYMYACMCRCMCICMYVCMYGPFTKASVIWLCLEACLRGGTWAPVEVCMCVCMVVVLIKVATYISAYIYTHIHTQGSVTEQESGQEDHTTRGSHGQMIAHDTYIHTYTGECD